MATGLYVITTPVSGVEERIITGVNGEIYPYHDSPELGKRIESYYRNHFLSHKKIPQGVLEKLRNDIGWNKVIEKVDKLLLK
jgi:glycosyltransferase involved in cell wall biosynthesis